MTYKKFLIPAFLSAYLLIACSDPDIVEPPQSLPNSQAPSSHGEGGHSDHDDPGGEEEHVKMDAATADIFGIVVSRAAKSPVREAVSSPAELRFDADRIASISPLVSGRLTRLLVGEGDMVDRGDTLAILSSRELADLKADYLVARSNEELAIQSLQREETLFADRITAEADVIAARAARAAARAQREGVENKLNAVGVSDAQLAGLQTVSDGSFATIRVKTPIGGVVAQRNAVLGASVSAEDASAAALFTIVDDSVLWADIAVYKQDTGRVRKGSEVVLRSETGTELARGAIATILPAIDETSRTATARLVVPNPDRSLRPGQFVTADILGNASGDAIQVSSDAIVEVEGQLSVFVPTADGFAPRQVRTGSRISDQTIVLSGLRAGELYVSDGAFTLKAQLEKDAFGDDHDH